MWFAAALRITLADGGRDGWGDGTVGARRRPPPAQRSGAMLLLQISVGAALAYSTSGSGNHILTSGLNDFAWRES
jgi:hypothetical protein